MASSTGHTPPATSFNTDVSNTISQTHQSLVKATQGEDDHHDITALGREQVFIRKFTFWSALGISVCCSGTWEGITAAAGQALYSGGPTALLYGYIVAAIGGVVLSASLAELASAWPTSGAMYHWMSALFGPKWRPFIGCVTGIFILGTGWIGTASAAFGVAIQTQAYVIVSHEEYVPERWHTVLMLWATLATAFILNLCGPKVAHYMNCCGMFIHLVGYVVIVIVLLACTKEKQSAEFVFKGFQNFQGWNDGIAWCIGLLSSAYGFVGVETAAYFAEEVQHASRNVPRAMVWNTIANGIITFPFIITLLFCIGDFESVLESPIGSTSPTTQIYINSTGSVGAGIAMNAFSTMIAFISTTDAMGAGCRCMFAMARDGMLPEVLAQVNARFDIPLNALFVVTIPPALLSIIYIGNSTAFYGFISAVLVATMIQYVVPISTMLYRKLFSEPPRGPWRLGRIQGVVVNTIAALWALFLMVVLSLPTTLPTTVETMNYSSVIIVGVLFLSFLTWVLYGRWSGYRGPLMAGGVADELIEGIPSTDIETTRSKADKHSNETVGERQ